MILKLNHYFKGADSSIRGWQREDGTSSHEQYIRKLWISIIDTHGRQRKLSNLLPGNSSGLHGECARFCAIHC
jgi:hypothetical protein